jgi:phenylalanyl-tRNA synthetase beta chain
MNISYNWLKEYLQFDLTPRETADRLTSIGLETGSVEEIQTIRGGLEGLVIGEVLTCTGCRTESGGGYRGHEAMAR